MIRDTPGLLHVSAVASANRTPRFNPRAGTTIHSVISTKSASKTYPTVEPLARLVGCCGVACKVRFHLP
jgi:hypothetical protein